jgi:lipopolysaccharide export system protein LptA
MKADVELHWQSILPNSKPMKLEAASLTYHEVTSEIWLKPWGRLTRENSVVEGQDCVVHLQDGTIRQVEASKAHGTDTYPNRKLDYSAAELWVDYNADGVVEKVTGQNDAQLKSTSSNSETDVSGYRVELHFTPQDSDSVLTTVSAAGHALISSKPLPVPGRQLSETHTLRSETVDMKMREGGRDIQTVTTGAAGTLEFFPNLPAQHHRTLDGNNFLISYAPQNRIESFRATDAKTRTDPSEEEQRRKRPPSFTASRVFLASFDPATSRMSRIEQTGDFTYEEGGRRARAAKATLDSEPEIMVLDTSARISDPTGATSATRIRMDQRTGNFTAEGDVHSNRLPDNNNKKANSELFSGDEPIQAVARKMDSSNRNQLIHYEGGAVLWQGANRIQADAIDVDREHHALTAAGNVVSNLWETDPKRPTVAPVITVVHAPHLVYTDDNRLAVYTGGVLLNRANMRVNSRELRAFLSGEGGDSRLEKAYADGAVTIVQVASDRTRTGTAEHSEYYTADQKVILRDGEPQLVDTLKGSTRGTELTYFANDDRLLVTGAPDHPVKSRIRRR